MPKHKIYKAAVVGCGYIGAGVKYFDKKIQPATHAGAYEGNPRIDLVALVDTAGEKLAEAKQYFPKVRCYTDLRKMILAEKPDIVSVATPTRYHYEQVMALAKCKVPVILCEKPLADTVARGKRMVEFCKQNGSQLFVNYQRHFDPYIQRWVKKVKQGILGTLYQGNVYYYNGLRNNAGHMLDLLNLFLGLPQAVSVRFNEVTETAGKGFNADGVMWYGHNLLITLQSLSKNYGYFSLSFFGEKGAISIHRGTSPEIEFRKKIPNKEAKLYFELSSVIQKEGGPRSTLAPTVAHLVSCLDKTSSPVSTGEDSLSVLRVLDLLEKSARAGGKRMTL